MEEKVLKFTLRVNEKTLRKFEYIAKYNARSTNGELEIVMRRHIAEFERKHHEEIVLSE